MDSTRAMTTEFLETIQTKSKHNLHVGQKDGLGFFSKNIRLPSQVILPSSLSSDRNYRSESGNSADQESVQGVRSLWATQPQKLRPSSPCAIPHEQAPQGPDKPQSV